jgi:hypothetical protein
MQSLGIGIKAHMRGGVLFTFMHHKQPQIPELNCTTDFLTKS